MWLSRKSLCEIMFLKKARELKFLSFLRSHLKQNVIFFKIFFVQNQIFRKKFPRRGPTFREKVAPILIFQIKKTTEKLTSQKKLNSKTLITGVFLQFTFWQVVWTLGQNRNFCQLSDSSPGTVKRFCFGIWF